MARPCKVCTHPKVKEIEEHLLLGDMPMREIAKSYGLSTGPLSGHKENHMPQVVQEVPAPVGPAPVARPQPGQFMTGEEVLDKLHWLIAKAEGVIRDAEEGGEKGKDNNLLLKAIDRIDRVTQTYVKFMELARDNDGQKALARWEEIGKVIWEFVDNEGLREKFEDELSRRGL